MTLHSPRVAYAFPRGPATVHEASGYVATIVSGEGHSAHGVRYRGTPGPVLRAPVSTMT